MNDRQRAVARLHAAGFSQRDIATRLGTSRAAVARVMQQLKLQPRGNAPAERRKRAAAYRKLCRTNGVPSLGTLSAVARRIEAARRERAGAREFDERPARGVASQAHQLGVKR